MDDAPPLKQRIYEMLMESQFWPPHDEALWLFLRWRHLASNS